MLDAAARSIPPGPFVTASVFSAALHQFTLPPFLMRRYLITTCDAIADAPYSVLWIQTQAGFWENCPGLTWLWRTYER